MSENAEIKAQRLLSSGQVQIRWAVGDVVDAVVMGDHGTYRVRWDHGRWSCECPNLGALLWVLHRNPRKELLGRLGEHLAAGRAIETDPGFDTEPRRRDWSAVVLFDLRRAVGATIANSFLASKGPLNPGDATTAVAAIRLQLAALTKIHDDVVHRAIPVRKGWRA